MSKNAYGVAIAPLSPTVTSKGKLHFLTSGQGQKVTLLGHAAYYLMRLTLDKGNIVKPTPGLYLIPIKSYKQKRTLNSWRHYLTSPFPEVTYAKLHRGHQQ